MTATQELLTAFDALPDAEGEAVLVELLRRRPTGGGDLPTETFEELADELFRSYDVAEEGSDAAPAG